MKKALLLLALIQGITLSAFAQTAAPADASKTRVEVKAETKAAAKAGELKTGDVAPVAATPAAPAEGKTRADVKAETKAANKAGELNKGGDIGTQPAPVVKKARAKKPAKAAKPMAEPAAK